MVVVRACGGYVSIEVSFFASFQLLFGDAYSHGPAVAAERARGSSARIIETRFFRVFRFLPHSVKFSAFMCVVVSTPPPPRLPMRRHVLSLACIAGAVYELKRSICDIWPQLVLCCVVWSEISCERRAVAVMTETGDELSDSAAITGE